MSLYSQDVTRFPSAPKGNSVYSNKKRTAFPAPTFTNYKYSTQLYTNLKFREPCIVIYSYNKSQQDALFLNFILVRNSTYFYPKWI